MIIFGKHCDVAPSVKPVLMASMPMWRGIMSTTIQNNQPTLFVGSTRDLLPTEKSTLDALPSEWQATESVGAKNNNRLAMQMLQSTTTPSALTMARVSVEIDKGPTDSLPPEIPKMLNEQNAGPAQTFIMENSGFLTVGFIWNSPEE